MTWFAWRSQRLQIVVGAIFVLLFMGWLYLTGTHEGAAWHNLVLNGCMHRRQPPQCGHLYNLFTTSDEWSLSNIFILNAIPALLGLFLGAPLVAREIEQGTNRLAWTQSITRSRWLTYKLVLGAIATLVVVAALVPVVGWWADAAHTGAHIVPRTYDVVGITPVAYALFAFMLGTALGTLIRRTGWAVAAGVAVFAATRLGVDHLRSHFAPLVETASGANEYAYTYPTNAWIQNSGIVPLNRLTPLPGKTWNSASTGFYKCTTNLLPKGGSEHQYSNAYRFCSVTLRLHYVIQYQPASHFWRLQEVESALYVLGALVLLGVTVWAVRRWRT